MCADRQPTAKSSEARRSSRERTFLPARISYGDGALSTECTTTQLSTTGARINLAPGVSLPERFDFAVPQRGLLCRARLIWRKDNQIGIEFDSLAPDEDSDVAKGYLGKIRELEAANAKLRAQVAELTLQVRRLTDE